MKLKRYIQFIKESIKEQIEEGTLWKLTEDDITDYMLEITDAGYYVSVEFGFSEKSKQYSYKDGKRVETEKDIFTDKVKSGDEVTPAYWIKIDKSDRIKNDDVTSTFQFACSIIEEEANAEIKINDSDGNLGEIDGIVIKDGLFFTDNWNSSEPELLEADDYIAIFAKSKDTVEFTEEDLVKYYDWSDAIIKDGNIYVEVNLEDMSDIMLSRSSSYKDILVKGEEDMYDNYYGSDYQPDIPSMIQYTLTKENNQLLIKAMIKELKVMKRKGKVTKNEQPDQLNEQLGAAAPVWGQITAFLATIPTGVFIAVAAWLLLRLLRCHIYGAMARISVSCGLDAQKSFLVKLSQLVFLDFRNLLETDNIFYGCG